MKIPLLKRAKEKMIQENLGLIYMTLSSHIVKFEFEQANWQKWWL